MITLSFYVERGKECLPWKEELTQKNQKGLSCVAVIYLATLVGLTAGRTMVMVMVMVVVVVIAHGIRIVFQVSGQIGLHQFVRVALSAAVNLDSGAGQGLFCALTDSAAD